MELCDRKTGFDEKRAITEDMKTDSMESRMQEAIRYLGYGRNAVDLDTRDMRFRSVWSRLTNAQRRARSAAFLSMEQMDG